MVQVVKPRPEVHYSLVKLINMQMVFHSRFILIDFHQY